MVHQIGFKLLGYELCDCEFESSSWPQTVSCFLAGESLEAIQAVPSSKEQMIENVEKVIEFMQARKIRMHHTTAIGNNRLYFV